MAKPSLFLFGFTLFLSAALMFDLQPMAGKMLLPIVGGTPSGWIVAMAFFQLMLLAGYFAAHLLSRCGPRLHGLLYIALLGTGCLFLPVSLARSAHGFNGAPGARDIFILLTVVLAVPFIALSATSSTIQRLFTTTGHSRAADPYFLYAASNVGSFFGLLLYPVLVEPQLTLTEQSRGWFYGYLFLIVLSVVCLLLAGERKESVKNDIAKREPVSWRQRLRWVFLAFIPSSLMLGVTTHITSDVISAPMIWVIPLSIYLLTYILAFSPRCPIPLKEAVRIHPAAVALVIGYMSLMGSVYQTWSVLFLHLFTFGLVAFMCHKRLADARPPAGDLTAFYLFLSIGGALGGILNAFIAPAVFNTAVEYPIILILSGFANPGLRAHLGKDRRDLAVIGLLCLLCYGIFSGANPALAAGPLLSSLLVVSFVLLSLHPRFMIVLGVLAILFYQYAHDGARNRLYQERNFFGIVRVYTHPVSYKGVMHTARFVTHGTTTHGVQIADDPKLARVKTTYYTEKGPLGGMIRQLRPHHIGVIGLGSGTIACYADRNRDVAFYEIDPAMVAVARDYFTFIKNCAPDAKIVLGDGRLELAKSEDRYDLLILDAFSSDMIPSHLLTQEALQVYLDHLTRHGMIALHLSNRYLHLENIIAAGARSLGLANRFRIDLHPQDELAYSSKWMVLTRAAPDFSAFTQADGWRTLSPPAGLRPWTDDYSNITDALTIFR